MAPPRPAARTPEGYLRAAGRAGLGRAATARALGAALRLAWESGGRAGLESVTPLRAYRVDARTMAPAEVPVALGEIEAALATIEAEGAGEPADFERAALHRARLDDAFGALGVLWGRRARDREGPARATLDAVAPAGGGAAAVGAAYWTAAALHYAALALWGPDPFSPPGLDLPRGAALPLAGAAAAAALYAAGRREPGRADALTLAALRGGAEGPSGLGSFLRGRR